MRGEADSLLARAMFGALVLACFGAFFVTQRLKHTPTVVQRFMGTPYFSPNGRRRLERQSFRIAHADEITVTVLDARGSQVATLVRDHPLAAYTQFRVSWDGRGGTRPREGPPAPAGEYRIRVSLRRQARSILAPRSFRLVIAARPGS